MPTTLSRFFSHPSFSSCLPLRSCICNKGVSANNPQQVLQSPPLFFLVFRCALSSHGSATKGVSANNPQQFFQPLLVFHCSWICNKRGLLCQQPSAGCSAITASPPACLPSSVVCELMHLQQMGQFRNKGDNSKANILPFLRIVGEWNPLDNDTFTLRVSSASMYRSPTPPPLPPFFSFLLELLYISLLPPFSVKLNS